MQVQKKVRLKIGHVFLVASNKGLQGVFWKAQQIAQSSQRNDDIHQILISTELQLHEYLDSKRLTFNLSLDIDGTDFQMDVWDNVKKIPYGHTKSYKEIATSLKNPHCSRAVGTANARNPLSIIIPCHRVIRCNGKLGGYAGGLHIKDKLLKLEKQDV